MSARWLIPAVTMSILLFIGCASEQPIRRPIPKEIVVRPETGEYTLVYEDAEPTNDLARLPETVPVVTIYEDRRCDGLLLVPAGRGYRKLVPEITDDGREAIILVPMQVAPLGRGWRLVVERQQFGEGVPRRSKSKPLQMGVPLDPPGPKGPKPSWGYEGIILRYDDVKR